MPSNSREGEPSRAERWAPRGSCRDPTTFADRDQELRSSFPAVVAPMTSMRVAFDYSLPARLIAIGALTLGAVSARGSRRRSSVGSACSRTSGSTSVASKSALHGGRICEASSNPSRRAGRSCETPGAPQRASRTSFRSRRSSRPGPSSRPSDRAFGRSHGDSSRCSWIRAGWRISGRRPSRSRGLIEGEKTRRAPGCFGSTTSFQA